MSYFSQSKGDRDSKNADSTSAAARPEGSGSASKSAQEIVSTLGPGLLITGNVVSTGAVQIFGRVFGDIHAARLLICKGAKVEGKVMAQDAVIDGDFKGVIHSNNVKLQATATVEGDIFKQSLVIEQNAQFEGVSRRLTTPIEAPTNEQVNGPINGSAKPAGAARTHEQHATSYAANGNAANQNGAAPDAIN